MALHPDLEASMSPLTATLRFTLATLLLLLLTSPVQAGEREDAMEHGFGVAMASALYHTHLFIAATSDAFQKGAYEVDQVQEILKTSAGVTFSMVKSLQAQIKVAKDDKERSLLEELAAVCEEVITEARLLSGYVNTSDPKLATSFAEKQRMVKGRIAGLLAL